MAISESWILRWRSSSVSSCTPRQACTQREASKIFRFKEQEQLHEEIIDTAWPRSTVAPRDRPQARRRRGCALDITLLDGKCFEKMLTFARKEQPLLLILGRVACTPTSARWTWAPTPRT